MTQPPDTDDMLAHIRAALELPSSPWATTLRIGPGVLDELKRVAKPVLSLAQLPLGVDVVEDGELAPGRWVFCDRHGDEMSAGVLPVVGATMRMTFEDGAEKDMRVVTVSRDEDGRITEYTVGDAAMIDGIPAVTRWFYGLDLTLDREETA